jgi:uncharacterized membrane protein
MRYLGKAALAGAATGQRATSAVSALIPAQAPGLPVALTRPVAAGVAQLGVTGELEQDKKPSTPSRLTPVGLGGRVVFASPRGGGACAPGGACCAAGGDRGLGRGACEREGRPRPPGGGR